MKEDERAGFDFYGDGVVICVGKSEGFVGAVKTLVVLHMLGPTICRVCAEPGMTPQAAVFSGGIVQGKPAAGE